MKTYGIGGGKTPTRSIRSYIRKDLRVMSLKDQEPWALTTALWPLGDACRRGSAFIDCVKGPVA